MTACRVLDETPMTPADAATFLRTTARTVVRWLSVGVKLADGRAVRLEGVRVGVLWRTSREACVRFVTATTDRPEESPPVVRPSAVGERQKSELRKLGIRV